VRVAKAIDTGFANSSTETKTETESAFQAGFAKQLGNIEFLILTIGAWSFSLCCWSRAIPWRFPFANAPATRGAEGDWITDRFVLFLFWRRRW